MTKDDCIFCKIGRGEIPSATVYETPEFKCFLDLAPGNKGHALLIPKEHFANVFEIDADTAGKLFSLGTEIARAIKDETGCDGMNLVQNNGECAGQTVHHFHLHFIPRFEGDWDGLKWPQGEADPKKKKKLAEAIRKRI